MSKSWKATRNHQNGLLLNPNRQIKVAYDSSTIDKILTPISKWTCGQTSIAFLSYPPSESQPWVYLRLGQSPKRQVSACIAGQPEQGSLGPWVWMDGLSFTPHTRLQPRPIRATAGFPLPGCASHSCVYGTNMLSMERLNIEAPHASEPASESESETEWKRRRERGQERKVLNAVEAVHVYYENPVCLELQFNTKMKVCLQNVLVCCLSTPTWQVRYFRGLFRSKTR